jgi:putative flavoprotein involved in K+ transport
MVRKKLQENTLSTSERMDEEAFDVLVVGAGAAGLGVGVALKHAGISNFQILDRETIGASFEAWPRGMQLITPSFPTNSIAMLDLNAIAIGTSPGYSLGLEHPSGRAYAAYLRSVAEYFELPTRSQTEVYSVEDTEDGFELDTSVGMLRAKHVVWATGEFQFPSIPDFEGAELGTHNSRVACWSEIAKLGKKPIVIIGGYESGIDAAVQLAKYRRESIVLGRESTWESQDSDPSRSLSPFTLQRLNEARESGFIELCGKTDVTQIRKNGKQFQVLSAIGESWTSDHAPILATGFRGGFQQIVERFAIRDDGYPVLNELDESTECANLFLAGPSVRHESLIFCFIYKYRQRFAIVANTIAQRLGLETEEFKKSYRQWGMFLDDLSCCGEQCVC